MGNLKTMSLKKNSSPKLKAILQTTNQLVKASQKYDVIFSAKGSNP